MGIRACFLRVGTITQVDGDRYLHIYIYIYSIYIFIFIFHILYYKCCHIPSCCYFLYHMFDNVFTIFDHISMNERVLKLDIETFAAIKVYHDY